LPRTPDFGLWYSASSSVALHGFWDADFAGRRLHRKSTSGTCQFLGSSLLSWSSRKQSSAAYSTTEADYVAAASCCSQLLWITNTMSDFGEEYTHVPLQCDSTSAVSVAKNSVLHSKTKHIELRYHFLRDNVEKGKITLIHVPTHDQLADIFTKPLDQASFTHLRGELGFCLISWVGVWELLCSICITFFYAFFAFGMAYVTWCILPLSQKECHSRNFRKDY
jgi:hypothetical protein